MRYLYAFGMVVLTAALWNPGKSTAQPVPASSYVQDQEHDRVQDRDRHDGDHDRDDRDHRYDRDRVPEGSYRETCRDVRVEGDRLYANCRRRNDSDWRSTSLKHFDRCRGEIANVNGRLECR